MVSVVMPSYNAVRYIETAVRSVMAQTYTDWELIIVDDGSSDDTCDVVRRLMAEDARIRLVQNPENKGVSYTRNHGLDLCTGDYTAFLDSDDVWHPEKLERQVQTALERQADLVYTSYAIVDAEGHPCKRPYLVPAQVDLNALLKENVIGCSTVLLSAAVAQRYRFLSDFYHEDYCLWLDILRDGHTAVGCADVLTDWRLIVNSRSFDKKNGARNRWRIYRRHLGFSVCKSIRYFAVYAWRGLKKYVK